MQRLKREIGWVYSHLSPDSRLIPSWQRQQRQAAAEMGRRSVYVSKKHPDGPAHHEMHRYHEVSISCTFRDLYCEPIRLCGEAMRVEGRDTTGGFGTRGLRRKIDKVRVWTRGWKAPAVFLTHRLPCHAGVIPIISSHLILQMSDFSI